MIATLSDCGRRFTLSGASWSRDYPVAELPGRIAFYETLAARKGGRFALHFQETVQSMVALRKRLGGAL